MSTHIEEYKNKHSLYKSFTEELEKLIVTLLGQSNIKYHFIESRTKTLQSFSNKVKGKKYINPIEEVTDISGLRIVTYYEEDIDGISSILKNSFTYFPAESIDKKQILNSNEFGYQSVHLILSINDERSKMPEWAIYEGMSFEVQVRTVLQHAWASISHQLDYKKKQDVPKLLRRKLFRLAGLFELADEEFSELRDEYDKLKKAVESNEKINDIDVSNELNLTTLQSYYQKNPEVISWINDSAKEGGFTVENDIEFDGKYMSHQLAIARGLGLMSIEAFDLLIRSLKTVATTVFQKIIIENSNETWFGGPMFFASLLLMYEDVDFTVDKMVELGWNKDTAEMAFSGIQKARKENSN